jgi:hypothetical protein
MICALNVLKAMRIWDIFLYEGSYYLYCVALALFKLNEEKLMQMKFEELLIFLQFNVSGNSNLNIEAVISTASELKDEVKQQVAHFEKQWQERRRRRERRKSRSLKLMRAKREEVKQQLTHSS